MGLNHGTEITPEINWESCVSVAF